ncbi:MAG TPA: hypothetical protein VFQ53_05275 [Kofleriaceae bacterium]|nr:hypothetical protein [Kofleriaceae bacterium]
MTRGLAATISIVLVALAVSPVARAPRDDGFPLSTYPMFAGNRSSELVLSYAFGETATGERRAIAPRLLGTGEVMQARALLDAAAVGTPAQRLVLCDAIASRVAGDGALADVIRIRIVTGTHDAIALLADGRRGREVDRVRCEVHREVRR